MITSFIQGGLGNQLFQIAAGLSLSKDIDSQFSLLSGQHHLPLQGNRIETYKPNILRHIKFFGDLDNTKFSIYREPSFKYVDIPKLDWLCLFGYFQSEKYFKHNAKLIKDTFIFDKIDIPKNSVSLHLRQGDYKKSQAIHPILTLDYFSKAIDLLGEYSKLYIVSDSELPDSFNFPNCEVVNTKNDYLDFCIMANCNHNIIANSTFSWWAAYLNNSENKKVIAPKTWFGPQGPQDWQDIYCEGWEVI